MPAASRSIALRRTGRAGGCPKIRAKTGVPCPEGCVAPPVSGRCMPAPVQPGPIQPVAGVAPMCCGTPRWSSLGHDPCVGRRPVQRVRATRGRGDATRRQGRGLAHGRCGRRAPRRGGGQHLERTDDAAAAAPRPPRRPSSRAAAGVIGGRPAGLRREAEFRDLRRGRAGSATALPRPAGRRGGSGTSTAGASAAWLPPKPRRGRPVRPARRTGSRAGSSRPARAAGRRGGSGTSTVSAGVSATAAGSARRPGPTRRPSAIGGAAAEQARQGAGRSRHGGHHRGDLGGDALALGGVVIAAVVVLVGLTDIALGGAVGAREIGHAVAQVGCRIVQSRGIARVAEAARGRVLDLHQAEGTAALGLRVVVALALDHRVDEACRNPVRLGLLLDQRVDVVARALPEGGGGHDRDGRRPGEGDAFRDPVLLVLWSS